MKKKLPTEIVELFKQAHALEKLLSKLLYVPFSYKRCVRCSREIEDNRSKGWAMIYELYPRLRDKSLSVDRTEGTVEVVEEKPKKNGKKYKEK